MCSKKSNKRIWLLILLPVLVSSIAWAAEPHIFYTDLESGPNSGGQGNAGAMVTIYGAHFGAARGSSYITVGKGKVASYLVWSDSKVTFQLGRLASTGDIVVATAAGISNGVPFVVRPGKIYYIATNGKDTSEGTYSQPWRTVLKARDAIKPGDIVYAMDGVSQNTDDGFGWSAALTMHAQSGGAPGAPKALVAYPGATVTIGNINGPLFGIRSTGPSSNWTFAGLSVRGAMATHIDGPTTNWRFVANDFSCPRSTQGSCFSISKTSNVKFLGNHVHDVGLENASALNHGVYFGTDSNHLEAGWNTIENVHGCRGLQVHSTAIESGTGHNQYDITIHDNVIHDTQCDGVVLATVDPSQGKVEVFNNIIYNAGKGPNNPERTGHWSCILASGTTNGGTPGGGVIEVYNNTLYNCGAFATPPYDNARAAIANGGNNPNLRIRIRNNIIYQNSKAPYLTIWDAKGVCRDRGNCPGIFGFNNLFFGNGSAPSNSNISGSVSANPRFVSETHYDFHLASGSPAIRSGTDTPSTTDREGFARGGALGRNLGALQFVGDQSIQFGK